MSRIISFLHTRTASWMSLILAVTVRIISVMFVSFAGRDKMALILQSKSLLEGKGLGIPHYYVDNIEIPVFDYAPLWPPGYPVLLAPFLKLFNNNIYWATTSVDILAGVGLIFLLRKMAIEMSFSVAATNIITLIAGCFNYPFIYESLPTDSISLLLFLTGVFLTIRALMNPAGSLKHLWSASLFLFLPCLFRYAYPPAVLAVPLAVLLYGWWVPGKQYVKKGAVILVTTSLMMIAFFIIMKVSTGYTGYILQTARGIYPENILHWYPFIPASFINLPFATSQLFHVAGLSLPQSMSLLEIFNVVLSVSLVVLFVYLFSRKTLFVRPDAFKLFLLTGFFIAAGSCALLAYLSFTYHIQERFIYKWNYIAEPRYFAFIYIYLQLAFTGWVTLYPSWKKNILTTGIVWACSIVLFIEISHSIYFHGKVAMNFKKYKSQTFRELDYTYFNSMIDSVMKAEPGADILVAGDSDHFHPYMASYLGHKGLFDGKTLNKRLPLVKKKTILLLMLYQDETPAYEPFLSRPGVQFLNQAAYSRYYLLEMNP